MATIDGSTQLERQYSSMSTSGGGRRLRASEGASFNRWRPSVFDFKGERSGSTCPTCRGSGRIPKGQESELVALIPYNDKRLKPQRTCLYVVLVAVVLILLGGLGALIAAFLYPRSVTLNILLLNNTVPHNNSETCPTHYHSVFLPVETIVNIKNANFFPVSVQVLNISLISSGVQVGLHSKYGVFMVPSRSSKNVAKKWDLTSQAIGAHVPVFRELNFQAAKDANFVVTVPQNATFQNAHRVRNVCCSGGDWTTNMYISASVVMQYKYLSQTSTSTVEYGNDVDCDTLQASVNASTVIPSALDS